MLEKIQAFENSIFNLKKQCVLDGRHVNSDNDLERQKQDVKLDFDNKIIQELILAILEILRHGLNDNVDKKEIWNQFCNLLVGRFALEFIKVKCPFLQLDSQKIQLWILLEVSQKTVENMFDHISQTELIAIYQIDSCIKDKFMKILELSRILATLPFKINGRLALIYEKYVKDQVVKDNSFLAGSPKDGQPQSGKILLTGTRFNLQAAPLKKSASQLLEKEIQPNLYAYNSTSINDISFKKSLNFDEPFMRESIQLNKVNSTKPIDSNASPIPRVMEESEEESRAKTEKHKNFNIRQILKLNFERNSSSNLFSEGLQQRATIGISENMIRGSIPPVQTEESVQRQPRVRPSQKLLSMSYSSIKECFTPKYKEATTMESQENKCMECNQPISKGFYFLGKNAYFCYFSGGWYCSQCIAQDKRPIWWKALEQFDVNCYKVSKRSLKEIDNLYTKPILQLDYDSEVVLKHPVLYEFFVLKRQIHLLYDVLCVPEFLEMQLKDHMNLCIKPNILSLKNFYDINNGSLTKLLTDVLALFIKHISSCDKCSKMGRTCGICNSEEKMYVFDLKNTTLCDRCNEMYHRNCLLVSDCERCKHEG